MRYFYDFVEFGAHTNVILKKRFYKYGNTYVIEIQPLFKETDKSIRVKIWQEMENEQDILIGQENLTKQNLIEAFRHTMYLDVLPYYYPLKAIQSFKTFARFILFPFFGVNIHQFHHLSTTFKDTVG